MERMVNSETSKGTEAPENVHDKMSLLKDLNEKIDEHKVDVDDVATFGESALEFVTSYDPENLCQSAIELQTHLHDVQDRLAYNW